MQRRLIITFSLQIFHSVRWLRIIGDPFRSSRSQPAFTRSLLTSSQLYGFSMIHTTVHSLTKTIPHPNQQPIHPRQSSLRLLHRLLTQLPVFPRTRRLSDLSSRTNASSDLWQILAIIQANPTLFYLSESKMRIAIWKRTSVQWTRRASSRQLLHVNTGQHHIFHLVQDVCYPWVYKALKEAHHSHQQLTSNETSAKKFEELREFIKRSAPSSEMIPTSSLWPLVHSTLSKKAMFFTGFQSSLSLETSQHQIPMRTLLHLFHHLLTIWSNQTQSNNMASQSLSTWITFHWNPTESLGVNEEAMLGLSPNQFKKGCAQLCSSSQKQTKHPLRPSPTELCDNHSHTEVTPFDATAASSSAVASTGLCQHVGVIPLLSQALHHRLFTFANELRSFSLSSNTALKMDHPLAHYLLTHYPSSSLPSSTQSFQILPSKHLQSNESIAKSIVLELLCPFLTAKTRTAAVHAVLSLQESDQPHQSTVHCTQCIAKAYDLIVYRQSGTRPSTVIDIPLLSLLSGWAFVSHLLPSLDDLLREALGREAEYSR